MPEKTRPGSQGAGVENEAIDARYPFGPLFFVSQLRGFVRDRCPDSQSELPELQLHLADGQTLDVCHVLAVAPAWIALAVYQEDASPRGARRMRTELIPYGMIARITLSTLRAAGAHVGFDVNRAPVIAMAADEGGRAAEQALLGARGRPPA